MGLRGPKALPANVHLLRNNPSKKPLASLFDEFRPEVDIPKVPPWLWAEAKKEWKRITPELKRYGLISQLDRAALVMYCQAWSEYVWLKQKLSEAMANAEIGREAAKAQGKEWFGDDGFKITTANGGFSYSPYGVAAKRAGDEVAKYLQAFGLSPSSRGRVTTGTSPQGKLFDDDSEWD